MDKTKIVNFINGLINDSTTPEQASELSSVISELDNIEAEVKTLSEKNVELSKRYVDLVKSAGFKDPTQKEDPKNGKPLTLEECISNQIAKRK